MIWYAGNLPDVANRYKMEWLACPPFKDADAFMILQVCADESYRLNDDDEKVVAIGGWLASPEQFQGFCPYWNAVLKAYDAPYFHFKEFADRKHLYCKQTPYDGWDELKRENFLFDLALVACEVGVPVGACVAPEKVTDTKKVLISVAYSAFFSGILELVTKKFEPSSKVDFIFDDTDDPIWLTTMKEHLRAFKECGAPFGNWEAQDDKVFMPLQAADLYAYMMRQNAERFYARNRAPGHPRLLDLILEKNRPDYENWRFQCKNWERLMRTVIKHYREWKKANPKEKYFPLVHCPLLQENEPTDTI